MELRALKSIAYSCLNQIEVVGGKFPLQEVCLGLEELELSPIEDFLSDQFCTLCNSGVYPVVL